MLSPEGNLRPWLATGLLAIFQSGALAWGPHPAITQAALDALGTNHPLALQLGLQTARLTNYCWMADYKRVPFTEPDQDFYADDYLLFPQAATHLDHICPEVKKTYRPYFERALQALRTENAANAARWIGSLLHFVEDTGSPPHAAEIRGDVHIKMENWVQASLIHLDGYRPQLLGTNDATALEGFLARMDQLIEFSKPRGKSLMTKVLIGHRAAVEPVVLESALETSRVAADLLHTLGHLAQPPAADTATVLGSIVSKSAPLLERVPARIVVLGTNWSTLTDEAGRFEFRGLPAGEYQAAAFRPGSGSTNVLLRLAAHQTNHLRVTLPEAPANLIRNGDFRVRWLRPDAPDCWTRTDLGWEGEIVPLQKGRRYRLKVDFKPGSAAQALVRWTHQLPHTLPPAMKLPKIDSRPLTAEESQLEFTGSDGMALLQVTIRSKSPPQEDCSAITLVTVEAKAE
jgi:hypothetical protein